MRHLTKEDRYYIEISLKQKHSITTIASDLGFHKSTISREIKKGMTEQFDYKTQKIKHVYLADVGERKRNEAIKNMGRPDKYKPSDDTLQEMTKLILDKKYSPEAALFKLHKRFCIKTFYNYVRKNKIPGLTIRNLPYCKVEKKKKSKLVKRAYKIKGRSIEERPAEILKRNEYGHWEMDTVYSARGDKAALLVLTERKTREEITIKIPDRTAPSVLKGLNKLERKLGAVNFRKKFLTITSDNGVEFSRWQEIEKSIINKKLPRTTLYFCHPYCSGERGSNENANRFHRRWIPKGDDIGLYSYAEIEQINEWINNYPRKMFGGLSSNEMKKLLGISM